MYTEARERNGRKKPKEIAVIEYFTARLVLRDCWNRLPLDLEGQAPEIRGRGVSAEEILSCHSLLPQKRAGTFPAPRREVPIDWLERGRKRERMEAPP